jgi:serine/threonine protein kinase
MAPEITAGGVPTFSSDIFSLGMVLTEMFTLRRSIPNEISTLIKIVEEDSSLDWVVRILSWMTHRNPSQRPLPSQLVKMWTLRDAPQLPVSKSYAIDDTPTMDDSEGF